MTDFIQSEALRGEWFVVARADSVVDEPVQITLLGEQIVMWRDASGEITAAPDRCPHREAPLSAGTVTGGVLTCPYHGWSFGADGTCVTIPSSRPDVPVPPTAHLQCVSTQVVYGLIWMCLGTPVGTVPAIAQETDAAFRRINTPVEPWQVSTPRLVDNFMDFSHFPWVHTGTFGAAQDPLVPNLDLGDLDGGYYGYRYEVEAANPEEATATSGSTEAVVHRVMTTGFHLPFSVRSTIAYEDGLQHILLLCSTPVDNIRSLFTFVVWRNDDHSTDPDEIIAFDMAIGAEDKAMLEQIPGTLPLGQTGLTSVQSDKPSVAWRRKFAELISADIEPA